MQWDRLQLAAPDWAPLAIGIACVLTLAVCWAYVRGELRGPLRWICLLLKLAAIGLLVCCLVEPMWTGQRPRPGANQFLVVADNSQSMNLQSSGRLQGDALVQLHADTQAWRTRLEQDFDVRNYTFDSQLRLARNPAELDFAGVTSDMHAALSTLGARFAERPVAGILLFTDGNATDLPQDLPANVPVYPVVDRNVAAAVDLRVHALTVTESNFDAAPVTVVADVRGQGFAGAEVAARLVDQQGSVLAEQTQALENGATEFRFRFRPEQSGLSFHRLEVFPAKQQEAFERDQAGRELTLANNRRWFQVDRGGGPFRILYVAGRTSWEHKFLQRALAEDEEVHLTSLVRIAKRQPKFTFQDRSGLDDRNKLFEGFDVEDDAAAEYDETVFLRLGVKSSEELAGGFPRDAETLFPFQAVIVNDLESRFFSADQLLLLRRFVAQRGGGLLMLGGKDSFDDGNYAKTPVAEILPVYLRGQRPPLDEPARAPTADRRSRRSAEPPEYRWLLTREGWLQDWTRLRGNEAAERKRLQQQIGFRTVNAAGGLKPGASLLAAVQAPSSDVSLPALATQRFGAGRSAAMLVGEQWRMGMYRADAKSNDLLQWWRQVVRWLIAEVPAQLNVDVQRPAGAGGPVRIQVDLRDDAFRLQDNADVEVEVTRPDGTTVPLTATASHAAAGRYEVEFHSHLPGPYRAEGRAKLPTGEQLEPRQAGWTSQVAADEFRQLEVNTDALAQLAQRSGGELIDVEQLESFVRSLPSRRVPVTESWAYPLWHQGWLLAVALGCLVSEWGLRRWKGLA